MKQVCFAAVSGCLAALLLGACGLAVPRPAPAAAPESRVYVVRRGWHTDIGFAVDAIPGPLAQLKRDFPGAAYLLFGFGDRRYLQMSNKASGSVLAILWPARGLVLGTGLSASPAQAFGAGNVVMLRVSQRQAAATADFVWQSLQRNAQGLVVPYAKGPYDGSLYYASTRIYAGVRTCNTWTAQALHAAGLPVQDFGLLFASQVWKQAQYLRSQP